MVKDGLTELPTIFGVVCPLVFMLNVDLFIGRSRNSIPPIKVPLFRLSEKGHVFAWRPLSPVSIHSRLNCFGAKRPGYPEFLFAI